MKRNRGKWKGRQLPRVESRTPWATSVLPLTHDSRTTTNPHTPYRPLAAQANVSWVRLLAPAGLFTFLYFHLIIHLLDTLFVCLFVCLFVVVVVVVVVVLFLFIFYCLRLSAAAREAASQLYALTQLINQVKKSLSMEPMSLKIGFKNSRALA